VTLSVGFNAYQDCLRDWSEGGFNPLVNPFMSEEMDPARDANGESEALRNARLNADFAANLAGDRSEDPHWKGNFGGWENYVEEAKVFYQLDESQSATADSVLREYVQRAKTLVSDQKRGPRVYRNRLLYYLLDHSGIMRYHPLQTLLGDGYEEMVEPIHALGKELKNRIDTIPTRVQRSAAEQRLRQVLAESGLHIDNKGE
jgi:hypothetical protein